jgi:hypothetical protein
MSCEYSNKMAIYGRHMPVAMLEQLPRLCDLSGYDAKIVCVRSTDKEWTTQGAEIAAIAVESTTAWHSVNDVVMKHANQARKMGLRVAVVGVPRKKLASEIQAMAEWVIY